MAEDPREDHIAIVGMACRFPGANTPEEFWKNLAAGIESTTRLTDEELREAGVEAHKIRDPSYVPVASMIDDMEGFDARFFGYTPREAEIRDPQGRLFLEACHTAIEDSGHDVARLDGQVGVFGGMANNYYGERNVARNAAMKAAVGNMSIEVSNSPDYLATTVSYRLGLRGPSINVQTACSTALVAVHLAAQSLRDGECDYALAGGVEVELPYGTGYTWNEGHIYSRTGHIRPFDADACGTLFGTGVGVIALKRLGDALRDRDHVYAVVRGSAVNNDGGDRAGFTAPGVQGQVQLIAEALAVAEVHPDTIGFVEAHATGTLVGDPIEVAGLTQAFRTAGASGTQTCPIGSVKANIGHLGPAAGVAGLIKVCMALRHRTIPPNINFDAPNPNLELGTSPFYVPTEVTPWKTGEHPRRAGVSSFGIGGTNAHLVIEETPEPADAPGAREPTRHRHVLPVSGRTATAAEEAARRQGEFLAGHPDVDLADVAYTLQNGRTAHPHRRAVVADSTTSAAEALQSDRSSRRLVSHGPVTPRRPLLMFPGQGAQHAGMGRDLYRTESVFREALDTCAELLRPHLGSDLRQLVLPETSGEEPAQARLRETRFSQPALFAISYAQSKLLESAGIRPVGLIGHSIGEYVAAHLAGVFDLPDVLEIVAARGRLMNTMSPGGMLSVAAHEARVAKLLPHGAEIAAVNGTLNTVVAGPERVLDQVTAACAAEELPCSRLQTSHAFHTAMMEPCLAEYRGVLTGFRMRAPQVPFVSNVTGTWITADQATDPDYWSGHLRSTVRFGEGIATLAAEEDVVLVEAGPGETLTRLARQALAGHTIPVIPTMRRPRHDTTDDAVFAEALGRLWVNGADVDWRTWTGEHRRIPLPTYPFERQTYFVAPDTVTPNAPAEKETEPLPADRCVFTPQWDEAPLEDPDPDPAAGHWLLFGSEHPVTDLLAAELATARTRVTVVRTGEGFTRQGPGRFTIRPESATDLTALMAELTDDPPTEIVQGFLLTEPSENPVSDSAVEQGMNHGFYHLLHLGQELAKAGFPHGIRLHVVSSNVQDVTGTETLEPAKSPLLGPVLLLEREIIGVTARSIDIDLPAAQSPDTLARRLVAEFCVTAPDRQIAWRGRKRRRLDYRTVPLRQSEVGPSTIRPDGTYLITGGLGGIGLAVAEELARIGPVTLLLMGRSPLPPRAEWPATASAPEADDVLRGKVQRLLELEKAGATVVPLRCDVSDEATLRAVLREVHAQHGPVHGVFHSAGVAGGGMMAVRGDDDAAQVLAPKVSGTLALYRQVGAEADFMMLFSSEIAVTGSFGQVDYCAANNFLDHFAAWSWQRDLPVVSIGWAGWVDFGMAADTESAAPTAFRRLETGARSEPAHHPLLDRLIRNGDDLRFTTVLSPGQHWVTAEHRVYGMDTMVGTALIEMVDGAYSEGVGGRADITDLFFLGPVGAAEPIEIHIVLTPDGTAHTATVSVAPPGAPPQAHTERLRCRLEPVAPTPAPVYDLDEIRDRCGRLVTREMRERTGHMMEYGARWTGAVTALTVGEGEELARVEIAEEYRAEVANYRLHPALLDVAVNAKHDKERLARGEDYLPLGYPRIHVRESLPSTFWVHIRHVSLGEGDVDTTDLTILDDDGRAVVEITGYAERRVDPGTTRTSLSDTSTAGPEGTAPQSFYGDALAEIGINAELGLDVLRRILRWRPEPLLVVTPEGIHHALRRSGSLNLNVVEKELSGDRITAVPATTERLVDIPYAAPETELQRTFAELWSSTLGVGDIGLDDDFFELGGNSLVAVQLAARIREVLSVTLPIAGLFDNPTIRTLAEYTTADAEDGENR